MRHPTCCKSLALSAVVIVVIGFMALRHRADAPSRQLAAVKEAPAYWYDPMHPSEHFDKPGKSPFMDMQLVPKYADSNAAAPGSIAIDPRVIQNLGVRFATVEQGRFARVIDTVGLVGVDEHRIESVQVRAPGWVERLDVRAVGDPVRRGRLLAGVYSPDLFATQQELMIARDSGDLRLVEAARRRLGLFGLSETQISRIETTGRPERRIEYYAPFDGYVTELGAREGAAVLPGTTLFQLADVSSVWVTAEVPEAQSAWIKAGDLADAEVPALPGEHFKGKIDYLYPELAPATRTLKVRVVLQNARQHLRPGMFATAHLRGAALERVLTVPSESIIRTGTRNIVIVAADDTHFRPVAVRIGAEDSGRAQILEGLDKGQRVVASGQFLIDSEANLRSAFGTLAGSNESMSTPPSLMPMPSMQPSDGAH